jgi:membrane protease YdiL (CAAX protease family)
MEDPNAATPPEVQVQPAPTPRWRWCLHLAVLTAYPVFAGIASMQKGGREGQTLLPADTGALWRTVVAELFFAGVLFSVAFLASRANAEQLLLKWRGGFWPILRGFFYSVGLRLGIFILLLVIMLPLTIFGGLDENAASIFRPKIENLVNAEALKNDPIYLWLNLTLVSFVLAGLREELWRVGMLAGLVGVFPKTFGTLKGQLMAIAIAAVIFGIGHLSQGWAGVAMTTLLGVGLGVIMVAQRSIWEAVLAHGFFNATTFFLLYLMAR